MPAQVVKKEGRLPVTREFAIAVSGYREPRLDRAVGRLREHLTAKTGVTLDAVGTKTTLLIDCRGAGAAVQALGEDESYTLDVTPQQARLSAAQPLGVLRGMETFLQLVERDGQESFVPAVQIADRPRFAWRGLMLDVSRHFQPVENVKRTLDGMAAVKMNVLHWHLSDDQGFRVESLTLPKLHQLGSDGQFYTQAQIRDVSAYARDRGIRVVPEFDVPGHAGSWLVGYPQYGSGRGPYAVARTWRILEPTFDPTRDETYAFLDRFFGEMSRLFPDAFMHIGGDEVNGREWRKNVRIQRFVKLRKLKNKAGLQAYFNNRLFKIISSHGKIMVGWDEILQANLPKEVVVQSWRGPRSMAKAAAAGYRTLRSAGFYLDQMDSAGKYYLVDPAQGPDGSTLSPEEQQKVLGGEACMWAEYVDAAALDSRVWPRAAAIAERFWSPAEVRDVNSMYERLAGVSHELTMLGLTHESGYLPALQRLTKGGAIEPLKTLADVVEPYKHYARGRAAYEAGNQDTTQIALNRLVDAARPESETAWEFNQAVERYMANGPGRAEDEARLRMWLTRWRDNDAKLQPTIAANPVLAEAAPISRNLSALGRIGLLALDRQPISAEDRQLLSAVTQDYPAEVELAVLPGVEKLAGACCAPAQ